MPIAAVRDGETLPQTLEELFREPAQMIHGTAYVITGHRQDAEDVLQSIFVKLLQQGVTPEVRQQPARYLYRAAVNLSLNVLRARKRRRHDYSDAEIAALLGTSRGTIAVTLYRIRARLKTLLRSVGSEGERA